VKKILWIEDEADKRPMRLLCNLLNRCFNPETHIVPARNWIEVETFFTSQSAPPVALILDVLLPSVVEPNREDGLRGGTHIYMRLFETQAFLKLLGTKFHLPVAILSNLGLEDLTKIEGEIRALHNGGQPVRAWRKTSSMYDTFPRELSQWLQTNNVTFK
jgi:hypothetical protein